MTKAHWVLDGPVLDDAGGVGGDIQVGPAISARFRSDDCPEARFEITVYAMAKTYAELNEASPECSHELVVLESHSDGVAEYAPMPDGHMACSWKPGTVDLQARYVFRMNGRMDGDVYVSDDSDHITYAWVGSLVGYDKEDGIVAEVERATKDAETVVQGWVANINTYLDWDGRTVPND